MPVWPNCIMVTMLEIKVEHISICTCVEGERIDGLGEGVLTVYHIPKSAALLKGNQACNHLRKIHILNLKFPQIFIQCGSNNMLTLLKCIMNRVFFRAETNKAATMHFSIVSMLLGHRCTTIATLPSSFS